MYALELAQLADTAMCCEIIRDGRNFQKEQGFEQWTEKYPNRDTILCDIQSKKGYVVKENNEIIGYMCIDFSGEPAYAKIKGEWRSDLPYAVIHRMVFNKKYRGAGLSEIAFKMIEELCIQHNIRNIRVDTDFLNKRMQHILKKNGFINCGVIVFQGGEKLAFDKLLSDI
ncbi:MAG: GNAT family N-acetyltransferase [Lachnospiraceae bacterium]